MKAWVEVAEGPMEDLARRARKLHTALLCDVLDQLGHREAFLGPDIRPISPGMVVVGRAFTLTAETTKEPPGEPYGKLFEAYGDMRQGDVIVIGSDGERRSGLWGELLTVAAQARGAVGAVTAGLVRDVAEITAMDFPVFSSGASPVDSDGRQYVVGYGEPVAFGPVKVATGDLVLGDAMGVITIPQHLAAEAVRLAEEKARGEDTVREELAAGSDIADVFRRYGIL